ncbi:MAG: hypothetical protein AB7E96_08010 [Deferribacterales bacterium]
MKAIKLMTIFALLVFFGGCAGGGAPVSPGDAQGSVASLGSKTFEVSKIQLMVAPQPAAASKILFDKLSGPYMAATMDPFFAQGLSELLKKDLGITVDYSKLRGQMKYKTSKKPGFVWDPNLYAWMATKKVSTGKQTIEIESFAPNPTISGFETVITVKNGSTVLKQYKTDTVMGADVPDADYGRRVQDYVAYIPVLLKLGIRGVMIHDRDMADYIKDYNSAVEYFKLKRNPPEENLKRLREMITDIDPSSGIVIEDLYGSGDKQADVPDEKPAEDKTEESGAKTGSGATLLD